MKKIILLALLAIGVTAQSQTTVPQKVTITGGTVIATPSGTQAVSGTVTIGSIPGSTVQVIAGGTTSTVNLNSSSFGSANYKWVSVQFIATSLDAADGVIKLQDSNDGTNWNDISGATITVASGTTSNMIRYSAFTGSVVRLVWTKGANTLGTISAIAILKQ